jgi:hypothetical protein
MRNQLKEDLLLFDPVFTNTMDKYDRVQAFCRCGHQLQRLDQIESWGRRADSDSLLHAFAYMCA